MISLDQVRLLEQKVEDMLASFTRLKNENSVLAKENTDLKAELEKLRVQCSRFEQDEAKLEQGILNVLNRLNDMEDAVQSVLEPTGTLQTAVPAAVPLAENTANYAAEQADTEKPAEAAAEPLPYTQVQQPFAEKSSGQAADAQLDIF